MDWKDTVMGQWTRYGKHFLKGKKEYLNSKAPDCDKHIEEAAVDAGCEAVAKAQAEISYKMGYNQAYLEGIKVVVEWIDGHSWIPENNIHAISIWGKEWQPKLKSWGL